jgi:hypothetical protein
MLLIWKVRYQDDYDKELKDRFRYLDTTTLDPVTKAAIELVVSTKTHHNDRSILKFKNHFLDGSPIEEHVDCKSFGSINSVGPLEYFEDEKGNEISIEKLIQNKTGEQNILVIPHGATQKDIDLMLAGPQTVPVELSLTDEDHNILSYFIRDLKELVESAFMKDGPGTLKTIGNSISQEFTTLETAVTDDEIRSFVTIFRRLYMSKEPANFEKACCVFTKALQDHPYSKWVAESHKEYLEDLKLPPQFEKFSIGEYSFSTKRLIDVFLYTQYAHQPSSDRERQFKECLANVSGNHAVLTWLFLTELNALALRIRNTGKVIAQWYLHLCKHNCKSPEVLESVRNHHAGLGSQEKKQLKHERLLREKIQQLAEQLWIDAGKPTEGSKIFIPKAQDLLQNQLKE